MKTTIARRHVGRTPLGSRVVVVALVAALVVAMVAVPAVSNAQANPADSDPPIATAADVDTMVGFSPDRGIPQGTQAVLSELMQDHELTGVNTLQWDDASKTLTVRYFDADVTVLQKRLD